VAPRSRLKLYLFLFLLLIISSPAPALAYGDPSGGFLFQVLTPILALLWGVWLAFAHSIHKVVSRLVSRLRGTEPVETSEEQQQNEIAAP